MEQIFSLETIIGFAVAYVVLFVIISFMNKVESKLDARLSEIEAAERKRKQAERARRRGGASTVAAPETQLMAAAVAAVHQFRAQN